LHIQQAVLPADDPLIAETFRSLADLYEKQGNHAQAQWALTRARTAVKTE
jgi:hypothetical protein